MVSTTATAMAPAQWRRWVEAIGTAVLGTVAGREVAAEQPALDPTELRQLLLDAGMLAPDAPTGSHSDRITAALRHFQRSVGLLPDGVAGPRTTHALSAAAAGTRELRELGLVA